MPDLIILESPNKVADVEKYAKKFGLQAIAAATGGHLVDLPPMRAGAGVDIQRFAPEQLVPRDQSARGRVSKLKAAIAGADRVIVATDPDREGEAIAAQVWSWIPKGKAWRARFEEITAAGIASGLSAMQPRLDEQAVDASVTRRLVDRLAGWHATSLVFEKLPQRGGLSAGRLQSAALRLVVERFREYQAFKPTVSFGLRLKVRGGSGEIFFARLLGEKDAAVFKAEAEARAFPVPQQLVVSDTMSTERAEKPRPPFEATSWLQVAQKALGLTVKEATAATQALFEGGSTTYPRTDSVRVSDEAITWARRELERRYGSDHVPAEPWAHRDGSGASQGAHEAIRPTLSDDDDELARRAAGQWGNAYALIEARFLASQAAARRVSRTEIHLVAAEHRYLAAGDVELFPGWKAVMGTEAREEDAVAKKGSDDHGEPSQEGLPHLGRGQTVEVLEAEVLTHTTKPRPLFSQAALVAELKRRGIGRPSTYHGVVPLLTGRAWVEERAWSAPGAKSRGGRRRLPVLIPTALGLELCDFLVAALPGLVDYEFTAELEHALDQVETGDKSRVEVGQRWWKAFERELVGAKGLEAKRAERMDLGGCPRCGTEGRAGRLRLIKGTNKTTGKSFEFAGCDADSKAARVCGYTTPTSRGKAVPSSPCPECGVVMRPVERRDGGHSLVCSTHGWFLADRNWAVVRAPACPQCSKAMVHRERSEAKGRYFWACFADGAFADADAFGQVKGAVRLRRDGVAGQRTADKRPGGN